MTETAQHDRTGEEIEKTPHKALLPTAGIDIFSTADHLKSAKETFKQDWTFARIQMCLHEGSLEQAVAHYKEHHSPDLLIIEVSEINDGLTLELEALANVCEEHTNCLLVGPVNDVQLYRKLIAMGISDYLVAPVSEADLAASIGEVLLKKSGQQDSRLTAFLGAKGGVGTSSVAYLMAEQLAESGHKTLYLDAAGAWNDLSVTAGVEPVDSLHALIKAAQNRDEDAITRMIQELSEYLHVAATGAQKLLNGAIDPDHFELLLDYMLQHYPQVVLDLSSAPEPVKTLFVQRAHEVALVTTADLSSLRVARLLRKEVNELRGGKASDQKLILNKVGLNKAQEARGKEISEGVGAEPDVTLPFAPKAFAARDMESKSLLAQPELKAVVETISELFDIALDGEAQKRGDTLAQGASGWLDAIGLGSK